MKTRVILLILLYLVYISRKREFIKNPTNTFQRARYHQDILIRPD